MRRHNSFTDKVTTSSSCAWHRIPAPHPHVSSGGPGPFSVGGKDASAAEGRGAPIFHAPVGWYLRFLSTTSSGMLIERQTVLPDDHMS